MSACVRSRRSGSRIVPGPSASRTGCTPQSQPGWIGISSDFEYFCVDAIAHSAQFSRPLSTLR